nr:MAG TPA: hypothetical protein [Caudoviricetes sp.]
MFFCSKCDIIGGVRNYGRKRSEFRGERRHGSKGG